MTVQCCRLHVGSELCECLYTVACSFVNPVNETETAEPTGAAHSVHAAAAALAAAPASDRTLKGNLVLGLGKLC